MPDLHRPDRVRVQDRPVHLLRRPVPPALQEIDLGRRPGVERGSSPRGAEPLRRGRRELPGRPGGCRAPGRRAPGWPGAPRVRRMRAPESGWRRAGQDGAHHRARQGEPGPRSARTRRDSRRRPPKPAPGGRLHPRADPARGSCCTAFVTGPVLPPHRRLGHRQPHGAPTTRPAPPSRRSGQRKHREGQCLTGLVHHSDHGSQYLSIAHAGRLVDEGTGRIGRSRGILLRRRRRRGPGQAPASAGPALARRPLEGPRRPPGPPPPSG